MFKIIGAIFGFFQGSIFGFIGMLVGAYIGSLVGRVIDSILFGRRDNHSNTRADEEAYRKFYEQFYQQSQNRYQHNYSMHSAQEVPDSCYETIGCNRNDTLDEIKKKYRKLVSMYHPDRLEGKKLSKSEFEIAENKFKDIQESYNQIKKEKGI